MSNSQLIFITFWSLFFLTFAYQKIKKSKVKVFDVVWWLVFGISLLLMIVFKDLINSITFFFFSAPVNAVFTIFIGFIIIIIFLQNLKISKNKEEITNLSHSISILEKKVRESKKE